MKKLIYFLVCAVLFSCGVTPNAEDELNLTSKFNSTWNIHESIETNLDGSITYNALAWGGLVGSVKKQNLPVDWSKYESITFEFAEPTKVATQIMISEKLKTLGRKGITSLKCNFDGQNVKSVSEVALQAAEPTTLKVKNVYLTPDNAVWESSPIWTGKCVFGNWENGIIVEADKFANAYEGDKIEFIFTTDTSNPEIGYWQFKTIFNGTETTLEGNDNELNDWGCATMGKEATVYRIVLTANDVANLKEKGLFVNGFYNVVSQCNLLRKGYSVQ